MREARHYLGYGLVIRAEFAIPGASPLSGSGLGADIEIAAGPVRLAGGRGVGPYWLSDGKLVFEAVGVARYLCTDSSITIDCLNGAGDDLITGYLVATALPAVLWMRGDIVLHVAAFLFPGNDGAFAIAGRSGSGKSSILQQMLQAGAQVLADDTLRVTMTASGVIGSGLPAGYFLGAPRSFHATPANRQTVSAPVSGLVILEMPRIAGPAEIRRLSILDALQGLLANRHRSRIPALLGLEAKLLHPLALLAGIVPVHAWRRREGAVTLDPQEIALLSGH